MRRSPPKSTIEDVPRDIDAPNVFKSSAPAVVVQCWCGLVERMDRRTLNRFTRSIWARFDERDLEVMRNEYQHADAPGVMRAVANTRQS